MDENIDAAAFWSNEAIAPLAVKNLTVPLFTEFPFELARFLSTLIRRAGDVDHGERV